MTNTPRLVWRKQKNGKTAYWVCRPDIVARGYPIKTKRLWHGTIPTDDEFDLISSQCQLLQSEAITWAHGGVAGDPRSLYDGTLASLIRVYETDADSPYRSLRFHTRGTYDRRMDIMKRAIGAARLAAVTFRDIKRWHESFAVGDRPARGHEMMTMLRIVVAFGTLLELPDCQRVKGILSGMTFPMPKKRRDFLTATQAVAIRRRAHDLGFPSIALAQAVQFECMLRQKDVIGEWVPVSEPGLSDVQAGGRKWLHGLHWSQIDNRLILRKVISKSLRGRDATGKKEQGTIEEFDLSVYPMVMEELAHITRRSGPVVVCEYSGLPWRTKPFQAKWREIAAAVGIPATVQNRDSRAGGITEATDATDNFDAVRRHAGHSQPSMTARYSRAHVEQKSEVERLRVIKRSLAKPSIA